MKIMLLEKFSHTPKGAISSTEIIIYLYALFTAQDADLAEARAEDEVVVMADLRLADRMLTKPGLCAIRFCRALVGADAVAKVQ